MANSREGSVYVPNSNDNPTYIWKMKNEKIHRITTISSTKMFLQIIITYIYIIIINIIIIIIIINRIIIIIIINI